jgi:hypothetical protein
MGEDPHEVIELITLISNQLSKFDDKEEDKDSKSHVKLLSTPRPSRSRMTMV